MASRNAQERCCDPVDWSKLGRCRRCMTLAAVLTALSWTAFAVVDEARYRPPLATILLILSAAFSSLLIAHGIAYLLKRGDDRTRQA